MPVLVSSPLHVGSGARSDGDANGKRFYLKGNPKPGNQLSEGERRLAAIMFTDIVGYTAITQASESTALALLQEHAGIVRPVFAKHGGKEVKMIGDSFLVEFSSALSATLCAVEIQRALYERNVSNPATRIQLRIGIHIGDVVHHENDVFGDAVNIASRIEPLASPGSVCISQQVYDQVWNKVEHPLAGLGKHELKNVQVPMEVYRIVLPWEKEAISGESKKVLPMVDRTSELSKLRLVLENAKQGEGNLVFIAGEAGVGKTRMAEELAKLAKESQFVALYGRCLRREGKIPYAPWIEQIRGFVRDSPPQFLYKVVGNYGAEAAKLVPEITASIGPVNTVSSGSVDQDRLRFMDGIAQVMVNISKESPLLVVVDDMNWADVGSLDLMLTAARQTGGHRMLVVGIYRDVEVEDDSELFEFLYDVKREKLGEVLTLRGLGKEDTGLLMAEAIGQGAVDPEFRDLVYAKTGGNPFFVEELMRSMIEQGILFRTSKGWERKPVSEIEIPSGVRAVIRQRLSNLDEECMGVLSVASVTSCESKEFSFGLLKAVTGMDEDKLVDAMDRIVRTRLIRETKMEGGLPGFIFTDHRIRDAIYDEMTSLRKGRYHVRTAQAIQEIYKDNLAEGYGVLAYHYLRGNNGQKTCEYALKAADQASAVYAHADAAKYLRIALEATEDSPDRATRSRILERLGEASRYSGRQDYAKYLEEAAQLADEVGEKERAARIYGNLAFWVFDNNRANTSAPSSYFEKANALLAGEGETAEKAQFYRTISRFYFLIGKLQEARELAAKALALSEKLNLPEVEAHALLTLAILAPPSEMNAKFRDMKRALNIGFEHSYYDVVMRALNNLVVDSQNTKESLAYADQALAYFEKLGYKPYADYSKLLVADSSIANGDIERGKTIAREFMADPSQSEASVERCTRTMGEAFLFQGRFKEAEEYLLRNFRAVEGAEDFQEVLAAEIDLGVLYVEMGEFAKGMAHLQRAVDAVREKGLDKVFTYASQLAGQLCYMIQGSIGLGDMDGARLVLKKARELSERTPTDLVVGAANVTEGFMLMAEKRFAEATAAYAKGAGLMKNGGLFFFLARIQEELSLAYLRGGDRDRAKAAFDEAAEMFTRMGAAYYLQRLKERTKE